MKAIESIKKAFAWMRQGFTAKKLTQNMVTKRSTSRGRGFTLLRMIPKKAPGKGKVKQDPQTAKISRRKICRRAGVPYPKLRIVGPSDPIPPKREGAGSVKHTPDGNKARRARVSAAARPGVANHPIERPRTVRRRLAKLAAKAAKAAA